MRALIIGSEGQLGRALQATVPRGVEVISPAESECDLTNFEQIDCWLAEVKPDVVFNAAAYTSVDKAEAEPDVAELLNARSVLELARASSKHDVRLVHISTDFVFDGANGTPYAPEATPNPLSVYGKTKLAGERAVSLICPNALIVRTAWVYAERGRNFVNTMLRVFTEKDEVKVVDDQIGSPTYAKNLALALWVFVGRDCSGVFHFTDAGVASWYDFAIAICEEALQRALIERPPPIIPISSREYPTAATRPSYSVLDKSKSWSIPGCPRQHWRSALRDMLQGLKQDG